MAHGPSTKWEDGRLIERALDTRSDVDSENFAEAKATKPYKVPSPTPSALTKGMVAKAVEASEVENKSLNRRSTRAK